MIDERGLGSEEIRVVTRTFTPEEAIGNPYDLDYPIKRGKEGLM